MVTNRIRNILTITYDPAQSRQTYRIAQVDNGHGYSCATDRDTVLLIQDR